MTDLKDDEDFVAATAPEAFLQQRLNECRAMLNNAHITCDDRPEHSCGYVHDCDGCGELLMISFRSRT